MNIVKGDLLDMASNGTFDVIVHGCNCFNTMGGGIARQIREQYPQAYQVDCQTVSGDIMKLGTFTSVMIDREDVDYPFLIVNAYTQYDFNRADSYSDVFEYASFEVILRKLAHVYPDKLFGFPMIGMGLAGGNKTRIMGMLGMFSETVKQTGGSMTLVEYG